MARKDAYLGTRPESIDEYDTSFRPHNGRDDKHILEFYDERYDCTKVIVAYNYRHRWNYCNFYVDWVLHTHQHSANNFINESVNPKYVDVSKVSSLTEQKVMMDLFKRYILQVY